MNPYRIVVTGTDGSDSALHAVEQAATIAAATGATSIIATAYLLQHPLYRGQSRAADALKDDGSQVIGNAPVHAVLRRARDRARAAGATSIELRAIVGAPVTVLVELAAEVHAELIVVGTPARRPRRSRRAASRRPNAPTRRPART